MNYLFWDICKSAPAFFKISFRIDFIFFSGCGVFQQNGRWYFNPENATVGVIVFPYQCTLSYTLNDSTVIKNMLIWKPVIIDPPLEDSSICNNRFTLHATTLYAGNYDYKWFPGIYLDNPDSNVTSGIISVTKDFIITAKDLTSGCMGRDTVTIKVNPIPNVTVCNDTIMPARQSIQLHASGASVYNWYPMKWMDSYTSGTPIAMPQAPVVYTVVGSNEYGCSDTAKVFIDIYDGMSIPNAFSPNNDGINDVFRIYNFGYQKIQEFRIFNRWGQQVFQTADSTKGWDGTQNGKPVPTGNYYFQIRLQTEDKEVELYKGQILLLR